ncbi:MAG: glycine oxidase [Solirubrobacteraceae bacterium]|nr:glycine oxidase [Solirubrobacteraceae bacterium]
MTSSQPELDMAVVGGGAVGLAVAWRAAQRGLRVGVFDREGDAGVASRVAAGMLAPVTEAEFGDHGRALLELGLEGARRWPAFAAELAAETGLDAGLRETGTLVVARDRDEAEALDREYAFRSGLGLRVSRLLPSEARRRESALAPTVRLALEAPDDHSVDPRRLTAALLTAARERGVSVRDAAVAGVTVEGAAVSGLELEGGERVSACHVVVAAGAWSGALAGIPDAARMPVRPVKGQIMRLRDPAGPGLLERALRFEGGYLVTRGDGGYVLGATVEERGFDTTVTAGGLFELLRDAIELVPGVSELVVEEIGAGLRPGTPDNLPIVGAGAVPGLVWATGHYRNGILLAPLTADLVADVVTGAPPSELLAACDPGRFSRERVPAGAP